MFQERMIWVDGKQIPKSQMPNVSCFKINGKWYSEKGLPPELAAYKRLWAASSPQSASDTVKKTTTLSASNTAATPVVTAKPADVKRVEVKTAEAKTDTKSDAKSESKSKS